jgi:hypothetical protein
MSKFSSNDPNRVRVVINGEEVDPSNLPQDLIKLKKGKNQGGSSGSSGCSSLIGCLVTLVIVASIGCGVLAAASAIFNFNIPFMNDIMTALTGIEAPKTQPLTTDPNNFDPFVGLEQAREFAGPDALLISISADYVRSDGTMDLNASYKPAPNTEYEFVRKVPRPEDAPPVGVAGSTNGQWYEPITIEVYRPGSRRHVTVMSGGSSASYDYTNEGMIREKDNPTTSISGEIIDDPQCTMKELWSIALENGAPSDAVAIIEYDSYGYDFNISGVVYLEFTANCKLKK